MKISPIKKKDMPETEMSHAGCSIKSNLTSPPHLLALSTHYKHTR